jgi:hypothetical protein
MHSWPGLELFRSVLLEGGNRVFAALNPELSAYRGNDPTLG